MSYVMIYRIVATVPNINTRYSTKYAAQENIMYNIITKNSLVLSILNGGICMLGDYLGKNQGSIITKAIFDNVTHATIGFFSAIILILESNHRIARTERCYLIFVSVFVSSLIDIDHFIVAKSLKLTVNLQYFVSCIKLLFTFKPKDICTVDRQHENVKLSDIVLLFYILY